MKICKNCNSEYETGNFCKKCGGVLVEKEVQATVCSKCGTPLEPGMKFCPECGTKVLQEKVLCPNCGIELKPGTKFCHECGTKVEEIRKEEKKLSDDKTHNPTTPKPNKEDLLEAKIKKVIAWSCGRQSTTWTLRTNMPMIGIGNNFNCICDHLEGRFRITISKVERKKINTVGDAVKVVRNHLNNKEESPQGEYLMKSSIQRMMMNGFPLFR